MPINIDAIIKILQTTNGFSVIEKLANAGISGTSGNDTLTGTQGNDFISGGAGSDVLNGGAGKDVLSGGADDDLLYGGAGNDLLLGGTGSDSLDGGDGTDEMWGNAGNDFYFIDSNDLIFEYANEGEDSVIIKNQILIKENFKLSFCKNHHIKKKMFFF